MEGTLAERLLSFGRFGKEKMDTVPSNSEKWWVAILLAIIFGVLSSAFMYGITNNFGMKFGYPTWGADGPTIIGLVLHMIVFALVIRFLLL